MRLALARAPRVGFRWRPLEREHERVDRRRVRLAFLVAAEAARGDGTVA